ncbi:MAG: DUF3604 domain-containing protein [Myxococcota bacterium]
MDAHHRSTRFPFAIAAAGLLLTACPSAPPPREPTSSAEAAAAAAGAGASSVPSAVFFGDLHVHTGLSADAYILGTRASIDDAYRYAKGEAIDHVSGTPIQAKRALDFLAVTDHAEYLGLAERLLDPATIGAGPAGDFVAGLSKVFALMTETIQDATPHPAWVDAERSTGAWQETIAAANRHDAPGRFTTLLGFEWSATPEGRNLHRNVIIDPGAAIPERAFSVFDAPTPEGLWAWMEAQRARGVRLLAIPHNSNLSDGAMFARTDSQGRPIDAEMAERRARNEPLVEVTQIKGTSETHPLLSPEDEYAGFEIWSSRVAVDGEDPNVAVAGSYVRDALETGLELEAAIGSNPYRFGLIGSTDSHSASSPVEEDNYSGKGVQDTSARMRLETTPIPDSVQSWGASGLAAVWARENSRHEIFAALERRETYATTGTRITLRFFGGWAFGSDSLAASDWIEGAYASGVPMGGVLAAQPAPEAAPSPGAPSFLVSAQQDPEGAKLDRLQIVKGWTEGGKAREAVIDVRVAPGGGAARLEAVWTDPDFDPGAESFYYVRVLERPTPRWSTLDAERLGLPPLANRPQTIQERAFSSPIWYSPSAGTPNARRG